MPDLAAAIAALGTKKALMFRLRRLSPVFQDGLHIAGGLGLFEASIDEDSIREIHGGGLFRVCIMQQHNGRYQFVRNIDTEIDGPPIIPDWLSEMLAKETACLPLNKSKD